LAELVRHVVEALNRFSADELDAFETDQIILQSSRAAKELWKFCNLTDVVFTAAVIGQRASADWWDLGALKRHCSPLLESAEGQFERADVAKCSSRAPRPVRHTAASRPLVLSRPSRPVSVAVQEHQGEHEE
jgi:hypothetical protein